VMFFPAVQHDKRGARIKLQIAAKDPNLKRWTEVAKLYNIEKTFYEGLNKASGGHPENWWIYRGKITMDSFLSVEMRQEDGAYREFTSLQTNEGWENTPWGDLKLYVGQAGLSVQTLFLARAPEAETGWPNRRLVRRKCANPHCTEDPSLDANMECSRCHILQYHNRKCQKEHWKEHKPFCRIPGSTDNKFLYSANKST
jgi:hypothetical protein